MTEWILAQDAAQRLGIKRATLYTYVSRGLLSPRRSGMESLFSRDEIDRLVRERRHPGAPVGVLAMRSIRSVVSEVREGELFLRGTPLAELADERFEDVVDLVLGPGDPEPIEVPAHLAEMSIERRLPALAWWAGSSRSAPTAETVGPAARGLLAVAARACGGGSGRVPEELFAALAGRRGGRGEVAVLNTVLVALVDHGLAASVVAARVAASARASAYDCLVAGYAALSGRLHGSVGPCAITVLREGSADVDGPVPGFGHWRHPAGDPRAEVVLARLAHVSGADPVLERVEDVARRVGRRPNIDAAVAAMVLTCALPEQTSEVCFQVGRTVGITAHVLEELDEESLRWRARDPQA